MHISKNTLIGISLILLSVVMLFLVSSFSSTLTAMQSGSCGMDPNVCPHSRNIPFEVVLGYSISLLIAAIGVFLILSDLRSAKLKNQSLEGWKRVISSLEGDEKSIYELIAAKDGVMFQSNIVDESGLAKVKVSRILDRLEARNLVERRRRGMSNVVVLKKSE
jgi:uncharacterized membrane protein